MIGLDRIVAIAVVAVVLAIGVAFGVRVAVRGVPTYGRVESIGGSPVLAKPLIAWWYWVLQPIARACVRLGLTANAVTWLSLVFGAGAGIAVGAGHLGLATILGIVGGLCDALDGMVARLRGEASDAGEVLDAAVDRYTEVFFLGGVAVLFRANVSVLLIALAALLGSFMISYSTAKAEALGVEAPRGMMRRHERAAYLLLGCAASALVGPVPLIAVTLLVAVIANASAVRRLIVIAERAR